MPLLAAKGDHVLKNTKRMSWQKSKDSTDGWRRRGKSHTEAHNPTPCANNAAYPPHEDHQAPTATRTAYRTRDATTRRLAPHDVGHQAEGDAYSEGDPIIRKE